MRAKPNIIYILADDMGCGDVSCLNENAAFRTPNFDRLGREGAVFSDAHASSAVCTPSRYSILTGRYNWRSRLKQGVLGGYSAPLLEEGRLTVPELLGRKGYRTACVGKWHLGWEWARTRVLPEAPDFGVTPGIDFTGPVRGGPLDRGFDTFYGISASLDMPPYVYVEDRRATAVPDHETEGFGQGFWRLGPTAPDFEHDKVLPTLTGRVLELIDRWREKPFFIYLPLPAPHTPILPTGEFRGASGTNCYGDFVLMCDEMVGRVLGKLEQTGLDSDTIVIYTSDNGCSPRADFETLARFGHYPSYIYRGAKADIYEGGHRVPLLVRWPGGISPGRVCDQTVCLADLMATLAELTGERLPEDAGEDSVSNLPLWLGGSRGAGGGPLREATVHHSINGSFSLRRGEWKLEMCPGSGGWSRPRPGERGAKAPPFQLYNLRTDPGERINRYGEEPKLEKELRSLLREYILSGRSTPGEPQPVDLSDWPQTAWIGAR